MKEKKSKVDIIYISASCLIYLWILVEIIMAITWIINGYDNEIFFLPIALTLFTPIAFYFIYEKIELFIHLNDIENTKSNLVHLKKIERALKKTHQDLDLENQKLLKTNTTVLNLLNKKIDSITKLEKPSTDSDSLENLNNEYVPDGYAPDEYKEEDNTKRSMNSSNN